MNLVTWNVTLMMSLLFFQEPAGAYSRLDSKGRYDDIGDLTERNLLDFARQISAGMVRMTSQSPQTSEISPSNNEHTLNCMSTTFRILACIRFHKANITWNGTYDLTITANLRISPSNNQHALNCMSTTNSEPLLALQLTTTSLKFQLKSNPIVLSRVHIPVLSTLIVSMATIYQVAWAAQV